MMSGAENTDRITTEVQMGLLLLRRLQLLAATRLLRQIFLLCWLILISSLGVLLLGR